MRSSPLLDKPPFAVPEHKYQSVLRDLRDYWPVITLEEGREHFVFNLLVLTGCKITGDFAELLWVLSMCASAINVRKLGIENLYRRALRHVAISYGQNAPLPTIGCY